MNTQKTVPVPRCVLKRNRFTNEQTQWFCYADDRHDNECDYKRNGIGRDTYFQWESLNASNGAELPFRYRYTIHYVTNDGEPQLIHEATTDQTQTKTLFLPPGHEVQLSLNAIDRTGYQSPTGMFYFDT